MGGSVLQWAGGIAVIRLIRMQIQDNQISIIRAELEKTPLDIGGRDIVMGFNEPSLKKSSKSVEPDLDSKLNARLPSYFLPAVILARQQKLRPRLIIISGINASLQWNVTDEVGKKIIMINNNLKTLFLKDFFHEFFINDFSIIEFFPMQDSLKISEEKLLQLWNSIEEKFSGEIETYTVELARYIYPKKFATETDKTKLEKMKPELLRAFKYAVAHLFVAGDINFDGNYIHNPIGYCWIGGEKEETFNAIRMMALSVLRGVEEDFFGRPVYLKDNINVVIKAEETVPPPYTGYYSGNRDRRILNEVTYENDLGLGYYDTHEKLHFDMDFLYSYIDKGEYEKFWKNFEKRYIDLKKRYCEAYNLTENF